MHRAVWNVSFCLGQEHGLWQYLQDRDHQRRVGLGNWGGEGQEEGETNEFSSARLHLSCVESSPHAGAWGSRERYVGAVVILESIDGVRMDGLGRNPQSEVWIKTPEALRWVQNRLGKSSKRGEWRNICHKSHGRVCLDKEDLATLLSIAKFVKRCGNRVPRQISSRS